jgi:hypothetical protein
MSSGDRGEPLVKRLFEDQGIGDESESDINE